MCIRDRHAAHERVLYEKFLHVFTNHQVSIQYLLIPQPLQLTHREMELVRENADFMQHLGVVLEDFGRDTVVLRGVPAVSYTHLAQKNLAELEQGETHQIGISSGDILQKVPMVENPLDREKDAKEQHKIEQMEEMGKALFSLDIMNMTPLDAFQLLVQWKEKYNIMDET